MIEILPDLIMMRGDDEHLCRCGNIIWYSARLTKKNYILACPHCDFLITIINGQRVTILLPEPFKREMLQFERGLLIDEYKSASEARKTEIMAVILGQH